MNKSKLIKGILGILLVFSGFFFLGKQMNLWDLLELPGYIKWEKRDILTTMESEEVIISLKNKKATCRVADKLVYETPKGIYISDVLCFDVDRDQEKEVVFLAWKRGSFGEHLPMWIQEDTKAFSQHIFIYDWDENRADRLDPIWMSSDLKMNVVFMEIVGDGVLRLENTQGLISHWIWGTWGLQNVDSK